MRDLRRAILAALVMLLPACAAERSPEDVAATAQAIVGGATSTTSQDAAVMIVMGGQFGCTGTLIAPNLVLTARHCVAADIDDSSDCGPALGDTEASAFAIALGVNADETKTVARGKRLFVPTTSNLCGSDIALIQLDTELTNAKIARVRFEKLVVGETATAVGYGAATPDGPPAATRRQRRTSIEAVGPASGSWPSKLEGPIPYEVPAGDLATGESTCFGDSGGPLFDEAGSVVGVTSRGIDGECVDRPSVYTSVSAHVKLIEDAAAAAGHPLGDVVEDDDASRTPTDPEDEESGDVGDEDDAARARTRRGYQPQPSAGCAVASMDARVVGSSRALSLFVGLALFAAASFRRRRSTK